MGQGFGPIYSKSELPRLNCGQWTASSLSYLSFFKVLKAYSRVLWWNIQMVTLILEKSKVRHWDLYPSQSCQYHDLWLGFQCFLVVSTQFWYVYIPHDLIKSFAHPLPERQFQNVSGNMLLLIPDTSLIPPNFTFCGPTRSLQPGRMHQIKTPNSQVHPNVKIAISFQLLGPKAKAFVKAIAWMFLWTS